MPSYYVQETISQFHNLKQGNRSVEEYSQEFEELMMKCEMREDERHILVRFLGGLDQKLAHKVELYPYSTLEALVLLAIKLEKQQEAKPKTETHRASIKVQSQAPRSTAHAPFTEVIRHLQTILLPLLPILAPNSHQTLFLLLGPP